MASKLCHVCLLVLSVLRMSASEQVDRLHQQRPHPNPKHYTSVRPTDPAPSCITQLSRINPEDSPTSFLNHHIDLSDYKDVTFKVLILVESNSFVWRSAVRDTWSRSYISSGSVYVLFAVNEVYGRHDLIQESERHRDMVLFSRVHSSDPESGRLIHYLYWVRSMFNFDYLLRTYDNYFIQVHRILDTLSSISLGTHLYLGYFRGNKTLIEEETSWFLCPSYTPHADEGAFILSTNLIERFLKQRNFLNYYHSVGATIGLWCSPYKDITLFHDISFDSGFVSRGCLNSYTVTSVNSSLHMNDLYEHYISTGLYCHDEYEIESSYHYDWTQLPSQCCQQKIS